MTTGSHATSFFDALVATIQAASAHNRQDQAPPAAVLWPDKDRQWVALLPLLKDRLPIFVLGKYSPDEHIGPAYWLRCVIARTIPDPRLPPEKVPVLYLPGYSRQDLRALETCPVELQPLAELQYRGVLWTQKNGRGWTVSAFLQSRDGGLEIGVKADQATKEALQRSLVNLAGETVEAIRRSAPLRASYLNRLIHPDIEKNVLRWLDDPKGYQVSCSDQEWAAFGVLCNSDFDFNPDRDSPVTVAEKLGGGEKKWPMVWQRYADAPGSYSGIPDRLREARRQMTLPIPDHSESWPQNNETAEAALRNALLRLSDLDSEAARRRILELEQSHCERRRGVWFTLEDAPLAKAIGHLAEVVEVTEQMVWGTSVSKIVHSYANTGWKADLAVLDALASVEKLDDVKAVRSAVRTVYRPWLERIVKVFQEAVASSETSYEAEAPPEVAPGTCLLFVDGLRFDLGQRLGTMLKKKGIETTVEPRLTALPSVTATAKPAISPAASALKGGEGFNTVVKANRSKVTAQLLRAAVEKVDFEILGPEELGDTARRGWAESGNIDEYGHNNGSKVAHYVGTELRRLAERIAGLLDHGWQRGGCSHGSRVVADARRSAQSRVAGTPHRDTERALCTPERRLSD